MMGTLLKNTKHLALFSIFFLFVDYCSAANYTWVKNGAAGNFSTPANWSPVGVPGVNDVAIFNGTGTANCTQDIPALVLQQINIAAAYTGTITNTTNSITLSVGYSQAGGTFNGGSGSINITGPWVVSGGTFNSTSGNMVLNSGPFTLSGTGVFNANLGTVTMFDDVSCSIDFQVNGSITFCNLVYSAVIGQTPICGFYTFSTNGILQVNCTFINAGGSRLVYNNGTINLRGNICTQHVGAAFSNIGNTLFIVNGTGSQTFYGWGGAAPVCTVAGVCDSIDDFARGRIPNLRIEKAPSDTFKIEGICNITGNYTYVSGVIATKTTGILAICGGAGSYTSVNGPPHTISNMALCGGLITFNTTLTSDSAVIWASTNPTVNATVVPAINATRNIVVASLGTTGGGDAVLNVTGTGTQTMYCNALLGEGTLPEVRLNSTNNIVITRAQYPAFCAPKAANANYLSNATQWTYNSGTISGDGIVCFNSSNGTNTITNAHTLPNISYHAPSGSAGSIKSPTATLTARDTLFTNGSGQLLINGQTDVTGSLYAMNNGFGTGGTGTITIKGTGNATFSSNYFTLPQQNGTNGFLPNVTIDKPSGTLTLIDTISVARNWTLLNGTVTAATGSNIFLHNTGFYLDMESGAGTMSFYDLTIVGTVNRSMTGSVGVNNRFLLSDGRVSLNNFKLSMNSSVPANLVRTTGYVISENVPASGYGRFEWSIGNATAGNTFTYPFAGATGTYIPFTFEVQTAGSAGGKLAVATYPTDYTLTPNNLPFPTSVTNINNILGANNYSREIDRYWIPEESGFTTNPVGRLTFTYRDVDFNLSQNAIVESRIEAHRWLPGTTAWQLPNGTSTRNNAANTVTIPNQNTFTPFTIVDPELPDLRIISSDTVICLGTAINFFDGNVPSPTTSQWFFPGGTPSSSTATNPTNILYSTLGCKTVILEGTYAGGTLRDTFPCFINVVNAAVVAVNDSDITCNGLTNGKVWVTNSGGTPPFTYTWSTGTQTNTPDSVRTGLAAGAYSITVDDAAGCGSTVTGTITAPTALTSTISGVNPLCNNGTNGSVTISVSGGTPFASGAPYTYAWTPNVSTSNTQAGLGAGVYSIVARDANGCTVTNSRTLTNPPALGLTMGKVDVTCFGTCNGQASVTVSGGTTPYSYLWSNGGTTATITGLCAGLYRVTATDLNSCSRVDSVQVLTPTDIVTTVTPTGVSCFGGTNGSATSSVTGGTGAATYSWQSLAGAVLGTGSNISGLSAGNYRLVVTKLTCTDTTLFTISTPTQIIPARTSVNVGCNGAATGRISVTFTGGPTGGPATTYAWRRNGTPIVPTTATITGLTAGTYTVIITVSGICTAFDTIVITQNPVLGSSTTQTNITCFNGANGSATVIPTGGTGNYTYAWTRLPAGTPIPGGNAATVNNLSAGTYRVVVTDDSLCTVFDTVTLSNPASLVLVLAKVDAECFGTATGRAWATASAGTAPYTYAWSRGTNTPPNDDTTRALLPGFVTVTVTDANGCFIVDSISIGQSSAITTNTSQTNVSCFGGNNGSATVTATGGPVGPVPTYVWLRNGNPVPGGNAATINNLTAATYTVTVTIGNCQAFDTVVITSPTEIIANIVSTNIACNGGNTGAATVTHTGGPTGTATYVWQRNFAPFAPTTATITGLTAGTYSVVVTINGCFGFDTIVIAQPTQLTSTTSQVDISCFNGTDGEATVTVSGGTLPYTYNWTLQPAGTFVGNTATITGLGAGVYQVEVTDDSSCALLDTVTLINPAALGLQKGGTNASCFGICDGEATIFASGGTTPYTYGWSNGDTTATIANLCAGRFYVTVTDAGGCANNDSILITQPTEINTSITSANVSCFGGNNGNATVTNTGGPTPPTSITYTWLRNGATFANNNVANITNLVAGTYTVTVDIDGCEAFDTIIITQPAQIVVTATSTNVTCFGTANGTATAAYTGGPSGTPTYTWQRNFAPFAPTTAAITGLAAGTYSVVVAVGGCFGFDTIVIIEPTQLTSTITGTNPNCNGGTVGSTATVTASGGTPFAGLNAYNYAWTLNGTPIGGNTATVSSFGAGQYIVTVTDSNSCAITDTIVLNNPPAIVIVKDSQNVRCFGETNGKAWVTVSGGTPGPITPYTIAWSGGVVTAPGDTINNLLAGTYTVTVTDGRGCTAIDTFVISQPPALGVTLATDSVSCFGGNDGRAWATASGGTGGFIYNWSPAGTPTNATGDTIIGLSNLTYSITVTDNSGCFSTNSVTVPQPAQLLLTHDSLNVNCFGGNDGEAWVTASGGSPGYTYDWSGGTPTNATGDTIGILAAGTYTVTVTDGNGCEAFDTVTITQPLAPLTVVLDSNSVSCFGLSNGKAWVTATGGTPIFGSYDYAWSAGTPIGLQDTIINLATGNYTVTVSDSNGCVAIDSVFITQPTLLALTKDSINVLCFGDNTGKAWVNISGGTANYNNVTWTGFGTPSGALNDTLNNLSAGTYTANVTDANGCAATATFVITQPTQLVLNMFADDVNCFGQSTGKAWVVVTGGTPGVPPYTYAWSGGTQAGAGDTIVGLIAGTYTVTVTDGNGCSAVNSVTILQPLAPLSVTLDSLNIACFGQTTGKAWATVAGGTGPYNYAWSGGTPSGIRGDTIINLAAGVYDVTITDNQGCTIVDSVDIIEPSLLVANTDSSDITCFGDSTGRAWVSATGGTFPYTFAWSGGNAVSNGDTIIGLGAGIYLVTVTDASGCTAIDSVKVNEPAELVLTMDSTNVSCNGANDGRAWVTATGGTPGYNYLWSSGTPTNATGDTIAPLSPGIYVVTVTDLFNCTKITDVTIDEPNLLLGNVQQVNVRCFGENSGRAWITAVGGTSPYNFAWSGGTPSGANGDTIINLVLGTYNVTITDANGCTYIDSAVITQPTQLLTVMDSIDLLCFGASTGRAWVTATGGTLGAGYDYTWSGGTPVGDGDTVRTLLAGTYFVTVTDDTGCTALNTVSINQPATPVSLVKDSINILCFGDSTGSAWVTASGGTLAGGNYTYTWSRGTPQGIGDTVTNLLFGVVRVTVTDGNGCEATTSFNITQPAQLFTSAGQRNVLCFGENTGKAWVTVTGGAGGYQYTWSGGGTPTGNGDTIINLVAGTYTVDVVDANGCTISDTVVITEPLAPLASTMDTSGVLCFGGNSGRAWVTATGGTSTPGGYSYTWSRGLPFGAGDTTLNLTAGSVSVTVTDVNGCTITNSITVTQPATALSIVMDSSDVTCFSACDGKAWVTATGGTTGYVYQWANTTNTTDTLSSLCPGNYVVTVTDANGCRAIDLVSVNQPNELLLTTVVDSSAYCNGNGRGQVTVTLTGGTGPYDYEWSNGPNTLASAATSNTNANINAGVYTVTVTDANGCSKISTIEVFERSGPQVVNIDITSTLCNQPNGAIILAVNTTDPGLDYDWSHDASLSSPIAGGLASATYTVTITDAATCDTVIDIFVPAIDKPVVDSVVIKDSYCGNEDGVASIQVSSGVAPYVFTWSHDTSLVTNVATGLIEGSYSVTVTDANGCDTSLTLSVVEIDGPSISVIPDVPQTIYAGQAVPIEVSLVSPIDSVYYEWLDFPGLDCYDCTNPVATPTRTTTYLVWVTDNFTGCQDTAFVTIVVKDETNIFIPNAITPNGDGSNDVWMVRELVTFPENEVIILNRWGDVVFSASPYQNDWDGTNNGNPLPAGTYYYIIKLDNISESVTGPITIIK